MDESFVVWALCVVLLVSAAVLKSAELFFAFLLLLAGYALGRCRG